MRLQLESGVSVVVEHLTTPSGQVCSLRVDDGDDGLPGTPIVAFSLTPAELLQLQQLLLTPQQRARLLKYIGDRIDSPQAALQAKVDAAPRVSRNAPCPCGSGKKFKLCHAQ